MHITPIAHQHLLLFHPALLKMHPSSFTYNTPRRQTNRLHQVVPDAPRAHRARIDLPIIAPRYDFEEEMASAMQVTQDEQDGDVFTTPGATLTDYHVDPKFSMTEMDSDIFVTPAPELPGCHFDPKNVIFMHKAREVDSGITQWETPEPGPWSPVVANRAPAVPITPPATPPIIVASDLVNAFKRTTMATIKTKFYEAQMLFPAVASMFVGK